MKDANARPPPKVEEPASRAMVIFSVSFYLVAAIVVRPKPSALWERAPVESPSAARTRLVGEATRASRRECCRAAGEPPRCALGMPAREHGVNAGSFGVFDEIQSRRSPRTTAADLM